MRNYITLFFCALVFLTACSDKPVVPPNIIPPEKMAVVMTEIHILDGKMYNVSQMPDSLYKYGAGYYTVMFKKHHTDTAQFRRSFLYYTKHPVVMDAIYDDVMKLLQTKLDSVTKIKTPKPPAAKPNQIKTLTPANALPAK